MPPAKSLSRNHIKLSYWHVGLAAFYALAEAALVYFLTRHDVRLWSGALWLLFPVILHLGLAWGSRERSEISRKISMIIGFFMFLAFPVGTFIAMFFFLPLTDWEPAPSIEGLGQAGRF